MKTKFLAFLLVACLLFPSIPVEAATTPTLSAPNYSVTYKGLSGTISIPFSGYYNITVAGSQGGTYGSTRAAGNKVSGKVWLNKGDLVSYSCKASPTAYTVTGTNMDVPAGNGGSLLINNKEFIYAAPGVSTTKAYTVPTGVNTVTLHRTGTAEPHTFNVHWHSAIGPVYAASSPGGCLTSGSHTHDALFACSKNYEVVDYDERDRGPCTGRHYHGLDANGQPESWSNNCRGCCCDEDCGIERVPVYDWVYRCGSPNNTWNLGCGYQQGHILNLYNLSQASSLVPAGFTETKAVNSDSAYFTLQLAEHNGLYNANTLAKTVGYNSYKYNVVINNNTVVYCKHGTLN